MEDDLYLFDQLIPMFIASIVKKPRGKEKFLYNSWHVHKVRNLGLAKIAGRAYQSYMYLHAPIVLLFVCQT